MSSCRFYGSVAVVSSMRRDVPVAIWPNPADRPPSGSQPELKICGAEWFSARAVHKSYRTTILGQTSDPALRRIGRKRHPDSLDAVNRSTLRSQGSRPGHQTGLATPEMPAQRVQRTTGLAGARVPRASRLIRPAYQAGRVVSCPLAAHSHANSCAQVGVKA